MRMTKKQRDIQYRFASKASDAEHDKAHWYNMFPCSGAKPSVPLMIPTPVPLGCACPTGICGCGQYLGYPPADVSVDMMRDDIREMRTARHIADDAEQKICEVSERDPIRNDAAPVAHGCGPIVTRREDR